MIKKFIKKYKNLLIIIGVTIFFFICFNIFFKSQFGGYDDFTININLSKVNGEYHTFGVLIHPFLAFFFTLFYRMCSFVNWFTIGIVLSIIISFIIVGNILYKKFSLPGLLIYILLLLTGFVPCILFVDFSLAGALLCGSSALCFLYYLDENKKGYSIISYILLIFGIFFRHKFGIIASLLLACICIVRLIFKHDKKYLKGFIFLILTLSLFFSYPLVYKIKGDSWYEFNSIRSKILDNNHIIKPLITSSESGWSQEKINMFYYRFFFDEDLFTIEELKNVYSNRSSVVLGKTYYSYVISMFFKDNSYVLPLMIFMFIVLIYGLSYNSFENRLIVLGSFIMSLLLLFITAYMGHMYFRGIGGFLIISLVFMLYSLKIPNNILFSLIITSLFIPLLVLSYFFISNQVNKLNNVDYTVYSQIYQYTNLKKNNIYLYTNALLDRAYSYNIYTQLPEDYLINTSKITGLEMRTAAQYDFMNRYGITNLGDALYQKDNIYIITDHLRLKYLIKYLEKTRNIDLDFSVDHMFNDNIASYKIKMV